MLRFIFAFVMICELGGCAGGSSSQNAGPAPSACSTSTPPVYANDVQNIFANSCNSCHSFNTYSSAVADAAAISARVSAKSMPPNGNLSTQDRTAIEQWVACGTK